LYFKILWKYDDWSFPFHHFLENGWFYRENTYKCSPLVTKWQIILHFHCCFNNKYTPYFLVLLCTYSLNSGFPTSFPYLISYNICTVSFFVFCW
jgi:hypothetical protein